MESVTNTPLYADTQEPFSYVAPLKPLYILIGKRERVIVDK
jgi:hypothetical protein